MTNVRPTPKNALDETRRILADLDRWATVADGQGRGRETLEALRLLARHCDAPRLEVEVVVLGDPASEDAVSAVRWAADADEDDRSAGAWPLRIRSTDFARVGARPVGTVTAPILVLACATNTPPSDAVCNRCLWLARDRALLVTAASSPPTWFHELAARLGEPAPLQVATDLTLPLRDRLLTILRSAPGLEVALLQARSVARAADTLLQASGETLAQDQRALKVRRALVQQCIAALQSRPLAGTAELMTNLRTKLTGLAGAFEALMQERIGVLIAPGGHSLTAEVEALTASLDALQQENQVHTTVTQIPSEVRAQVQGILDQRLRPHLLADLEASVAMLRAGQEEIAAFLDQAGVPPHIPQWQHLAEEQVRRVIEPLTTAVIGYRGEIHRRGIFEMFMLARRYQMVFYVLATLFGAGIARDPKQREMWIALSVVLLGIGFVIMSRTVRKERAYALGREVERAREAMRMEVRRLLAEVERTWATFLVRHVREQFQSMQHQLDAPLRDHLARRTAEVSDEKQRVQRQIQTLETGERRLVAVSRRREELTQRLAQFRGHLEQMMTPALEASEERSA